MKIWLIIINAIFGLILIMAWPLGLFMVFGMSMAENMSNKANVSPSMFNLSIISYPIIYIASLLYSIKLFKAELAQQAILVSFIPVLAVIWALFSFSQAFGK